MRTLFVGADRFVAVERRFAPHAPGTDRARSSTCAAVARRAREDASGRDRARQATHAHAHRDVAAARGALLARRDALRRRARRRARDRRARAKPTSTKELHLALGLVDELTTKTFDPSKHPDAYRSAVTAAVEKKLRKGEEVIDEDVVTTNDQRGGTVIDLAEILERSLRRAKHVKRPAARHRKAS